MPDNNANNNANNNTSGGAASSATSKKGSNRRRRRALIIILIVLAVVTAIGFTGYIIGRGSRGQAEQASNFYGYPTVSSVISSSKSGRQHTIDIDLVVEYSDGVTETISHDAIYEQMTKAISSLDYDDLRQFDSVEHIESVVKDELLGITGEETIKGVYVGNIAIDFPGFVNSNQQNALDSQSSQRMKGLFKSMQ